jgi:hypothetical protein
VDICQYSNALVQFSHYPKSLSFEMQKAGCGDPFSLQFVTISPQDSEHKARYFNGEGGAGKRPGVMHALGRKFLQIDFAIGHTFSLQNKGSQLQSEQPCATQGRKQDTVKSQKSLCTPVHVSSISSKLKQWASLSTGCHSEMW